MITARQWRKMPAGALLRSADGYHILLIDRTEFKTMRMMAVNVNTEHILSDGTLYYGKAREYPCWMTEERQFLKLWTRVA